MEGFSNMTETRQPVDTRALLAELQTYPIWRRDATVTLLPRIVRIALKAQLATEQDSDVDSLRDLLQFTFAAEPLQPLSFHERQRQRGGMRAWLRRRFPSRFSPWKPRHVIHADELGVALWEFVRSREDFDQAATILARDTTVKPPEIRLELFALRAHAVHWAVSNLFDHGPYNVVNSWLFTSIEAFSTTLENEDVHIFTHGRLIRADLGAITGRVAPAFGASSSHSAFYHVVPMFARLRAYGSQAGFTYGPHPAYSNLPWLKSAIDVFADALSITNPALVGLARTAAVACYEGASEFIREFGVLPRN
jgi:hypothetical protein